MNINDTCIYFRSFPKYYARESSGAKPYTARWLTFSEYDQIINGSNIKHIHINEYLTTQSFTAEITDICKLGEVAGRVLVGIAFSDIKQEKY